LNVAHSEIPLPYSARAFSTPNDAGFSTRSNMSIYLSSHRSVVCHAALHEEKIDTHSYARAPRITCRSWSFESGDRFSVVGLSGASSLHVADLGHDRSGFHFEQHIYFWLVFECVDNDSHFTGQTFSPKAALGVDINIRDTMLSWIDLIKMTMHKHGSVDCAESTLGMHKCILTWLMVDNQLMAWLFGIWLSLLCLSWTSTFFVRSPSLRQLCQITIVSLDSGFLYYISRFGQLQNHVGNMRDQPAFIPYSLMLPRLIASAVFIVGLALIILDWQKRASGHTAAPDKLL